jgi:hypothetical protein
MEPTHGQLAILFATNEIISVVLIVPSIEYIEVYLIRYLSSAIPLHVYTSTSLHLCNSVPLQLCTYANLQLCNSRPLQLYTSTSLHLCTSAPMQFNNSAIPHFCTSALLHFCTSTLLHFCNAAPPPVHLHTGNLLQCHKPANLIRKNNATWPPHHHKLAK